MSKVLEEKLEKMSPKEQALWALRHTAEHVLHTAMQNLYPSLKKAMGPATADGFYFDFDLDQKISEEDFPKIDKEMKRLIDLDLPMIQEFISVKVAGEIFKNNPYKLEWVNEIEKRGEKVSIYKMGDMDLDLCSGPHAASTGKIKAYKLLSVAGAYWHGDEKNKMLTRIYGTVFPTKAGLDEYLQQLEEAKIRDHRKLNLNLKIFMTSPEIGQGLVSLLPNGAIIAQELEKWAIETENKWGYVRVYTPHIVPEQLFRISGHVPYYVDHMFPKMQMSEIDSEENETYYLKPMNCAGHHMIYKSEPRSYRDLPLRIAEYGAVYRYEKSGELYGMMRVRGPIHQNDAHIFCTEEQAEIEFQKVMELHEYYYHTLGINKKDYYLSFAIRDPKNKDKYAGEDAIWEKAEKIALKYIKQTGIPYEIEVGGAAFYGPKIDFNIKTVTGKVFSASTNQLDFFLPRAFGLTYIDKDGKEKTPVCIHRAPLGAHVRFIAFLIEHYAGNFPTWLTPVQVKVLPITDKHLEYAQNIHQKLLDTGIRSELDSRNEPLTGRIRDAQLEKVSYMLVVGDKEVTAGTVTQRARNGQASGPFPIETFIENINKEIKNKTH